MVIIKKEEHQRKSKLISIIKTRRIDKIRFVNKALFQTIVFFIILLRESKMRSKAYSN